MGTEAAKTKLMELRAAAAATTTYVASSDIKIPNARTASLVVRIAHGSVTSQISIVPQGSFDGEGETPTWYPFGATNGTFTERDLSNFTAGAPDTGKDFLSLDYGPLEIRSSVGDGASDVAVLHVPLSVGAFRRLRVLVAQIDGGAASTVTVLAAAST
jgi:hypothetical protein